MFIWTFADQDSAELIGVHDRSTLPDDAIFYSGARITTPVRTPAVVFEGSRDLIAARMALESNLGAPLVSVELRKVLEEKCFSDAQFIPARVVASDGDITSFTILNVVRRVRAIDHRRSRYTCFSGTKAIMGFERLALKHNALSDYSLARDEEYLPFLLVSEELGKLLLSLAMVGVDFCRPESLSL